MNARGPSGPALAIGAGTDAGLPVRRPRIQGLALGAAGLALLTACAAAPEPGKSRELTAAERASLSHVLEPLLTAAGLWRGFADGCAAELGVVRADHVGVLLIPHVPCRVKLVLTEGAFTRLDLGTLRVVLAHELAHVQLGHPDARRERQEGRKRSEQGVKSASSVASKAAGLVPGVGWWISKGIGTARKAATVAMEAQGNPYLPDEERAADSLAARYLNEAEPSGCRALAALLEERVGNPGEDVWAPWLREHPVSAERTEALVALCPEPAARRDSRPIGPPGARRRVPAGRGAATLSARA